MFEKIKEFEEYLSRITGAPYVVATDCCTHAIELCFRLNKPDYVMFTPYTYLSIPMLMKKLEIPFSYIDEKEQTWKGEYKFFNTDVWDSARKLSTGMYREGQKQCLSFGFDKPLNIGRGGAILLDDKDDYIALKEMAYDGRNLDITPWEKQKTFKVGYHYKMTIEEAYQGCKDLMLLEAFCDNDIIDIEKNKKYPDLREIEIV